MSFPNIIFGSYGDEKVVSSTKVHGHGLGQLMMLPDGRKFRYARAGVGALAVGQILRQPAMANTAMYQGAAVAASAAAGVNEITVTTADTTFVEDYYEDGYVYTNLSAGLGSVYKLGPHLAATGSSDNIVFKFAPNDKLALAIDTGTKVGLRRNEYADVVINPTGSAFGGIICGVAPIAATVGYYFWVQRSGPAVGLTDSNTTTVIGEGVSAASNKAGSITISSTADDQLIDRIGHSLAVGAGGSYIMFNLELE